jgi:hypothetical protein
MVMIYFLVVSWTLSADTEETHQQPLEYFSSGSDATSRIMKYEWRAWVVVKSCPCTYLIKCCAMKKYGGVAI